MSQTELDAIAAEEAAMRASLDALALRKRELLRVAAEAKDAADAAALASKPIEVIVKRIQSGTIIAISEYRPDVTEAWRSIPSRRWRSGDTENSVSLSDWEATKAALLALPFVTISYLPGVEETLAWNLSAPPWTIETDGRNFKCIPGPNTGSSTFGSIPGASYVSTFGTKTFGPGYFYLVPFSEGWRIPEVLAKSEGAAFSDEAKTLILEQVTNRATLNAIALKKESDFAKIDLLTRIVWNEMKQAHEPFADMVRSMKHQPPMIEYMYTCGGRMIDADDTGLGKTICGIAYWEIIRAEIEAAGGRAQFVIIVKAASIPEWRRQLTNLTGASPYVCITGSPNPHDFNKIMIQRATYVLISYDTLGAYIARDEDGNECKANIHGSTLIYPWVEIIKMSKPDGITLDEAQSAKNAKAYRTKAVFSLPYKETPHVIPMTATPILNRTDELGPLLKLVQPNMFESLEEFRRNYTIDGKGREPRNVVALHDMMRTCFMRREKKDVFENFPEVNRIQKFYDLSKPAQDAVAEVMSGLYTQLALYDPAGVGGETSKVMNVLSEIQRINQICAADKAIHYTPALAEEIAEAANGEIGKKKILIFAHWLGAAHKIAEILNERDPGSAVCTVTNDGAAFHSMTTHERDALLQMYAHNERVKYIVTTESMKEGHNMDYVWWVIFNDPWWSPLAHYQGESRGTRITNLHGVDSFYVIADTLVEIERYKLLTSKLAIHNTLIVGIEATRILGGNIANELVKKLKEVMWQK